MNRQQAMASLGDQLGVGPIPTSISGLVASLGGTRAVAALMPGDAKLSSKQRTLQRYMNAEKGTGRQARGTTAQAHDRLTGDLRNTLAEREKAAAQAKHPSGFSAKVTGDFFKSTSQKGRSVKPVQIDAADMEAIIDEIQAGDYEGAAHAFDDAYGASYDVPGMSWGETGGADDDAYDSLTIE